VRSKRLWISGAERIDQRLQKASLKTKLQNLDLTDDGG